MSTSVMHVSKMLLISILFFSPQVLITVKLSNTELSLTETVSCEENDCGPNADCFETKIKGTDTVVGKSCQCIFGGVYLYNPQWNGCNECFVDSDCYSFEYCDNENFCQEY